jgi:hypothetical protein
MTKYSSWIFLKSKFTRLALCTHLLFVLRERGSVAEVPETLLGFEVAGLSVQLQLRNNQAHRF